MLESPPGSAVGPGVSVSRSAPPRRLRVLSVPSAHPYVAHLSAPADDSVVRLADPPVPGAPAGQWWPHAGLDAAWVRANAHRFDLMHTHFGFEHRTPRELRALVGELRDLGRPLVHTVHDLRNPHLRDQRVHEAQLDVLVPAADAVVTLTAGAGAAVHRRYGRRPVVIPHPHVVPLDEIPAPRPEPSGFVVGLHLKSLRPTVRALPVLRALVTAVTCSPGAELLVTLHREATDPGHRAYDAELLAALHELDETGALRLDVVDRFDDPRLWAYLRGLGLSVLPYGSGTHSGWLEACHDLGTPVLAPDTGHWHEQQDCLAYRLADDGTPDVASLAAGVRAAMSRPPRAGGHALAAERRLQREQVAAAHREIYRDVLSGVRR